MFEGLFVYFMQSFLFSSGSSSIGHMNSLQLWAVISQREREKERKRERETEREREKGKEIYDEEYNKHSKEKKKKHKNIRKIG